MAQRRAKYAEQRGLLDTVCGAAVWSTSLVTLLVVQLVLVVLLLTGRKRYQLGHVAGRLLVVANHELLTCVVLLFVLRKLFGLHIQGLQKFSCPLFLDDLVRCTRGFYLKAYLETLFSFYPGCLWQSLQAEF